MHPWGIDGADICLAGVSRDPAILAHSAAVSVQTTRPFTQQLTDISVDPEHARSLRASLLKPLADDENAIVFGSYGRLIKYTQDFMDRAQAILRQVENAVLFIGGTGNGDMISDAIKSSDVGDRIAFVPQYVNGYLVSSAIDVFLDTDSFPGGISCLECQIKGVPVVWKHDEAGDNFAMLISNRDEELLARDDQEYVSKAVMLANAETRQRARTRAQAIATNSSDCTQAAREIEDFLSEQLNALCHHHLRKEA